MSVLVQQGQMAKSGKFHLRTRCFSLRFQSVCSVYASVYAGRKRVKLKLTLHFDTHGGLEVLEFTDRTQVMPKSTNRLHRTGSGTGRNGGLKMRMRQDALPLGLRCRMFRSWRGSMVLSCWRGVIRTTQRAYRTRRVTGRTIAKGVRVWQTTSTQTSWTLSARTCVGGLS